MMRPLTIAACLALTTAVAFADDVTPVQSTPTAAPPAVATTATPANPQGDAVRGKQLAFTCHGCHGVTGYQNAYPSYHVPKIGGQSSTYLVNALTEYRKGTRKHPTMQAQAQSFSDQDIADLASYLSSLK